MTEAAEIKVEAMDDDRTFADELITDSTPVERVCGLPTDADCETESEETNAGHQNENDAKEAHFFTPSALLFGTADAFGLKKAWLSVLDPT